MDNEVGFNGWDYLTKEIFKLPLRSKSTKNFRELETAPPLYAEAAPPSLFTGHRRALAHGLVSPECLAQVAHTQCIKPCARCLYIEQRGQAVIVFDVLGGLEVDDKLDDMFKYPPSARGRTPEGWEN